MKQARSQDLRKNKDIKKHSFVFDTLT